MPDSICQIGGEIPEDHRTGATGSVAIVGRRIFVVGGAQAGQFDPTMPWLDEYDPATMSWCSLPNTPSNRDHLQVVAWDGQIIAIGEENNGGLVPAVEGYDIGKAAWHTLPESANMPLSGITAAIA